MKYFALAICALLITLGCADPLTLDDPTVQHANRVLPKSYEAPTPESVMDQSSWMYAGVVELGGETQLGSVTQLTAFDAQLSAGADVTLMGWSSGWTSLHVFGATPDQGSWTQIQSMGLSKPLDPNVEGGELTFSVPFTGHYLLMLEPVVDEEVEFLLRLDCVDRC